MPTDTLTATVCPNEFPVRHNVCEDREYITFAVPNAFEDVKKVSRKVLLFDGRKFVFSCWNSDRNECVFVRSMKVPPATATFVKA